MSRRWSVSEYTEVRELGRGATGVVVLARHDASGQHVAVKYLSDDLLDENGFVQEFRAEAQTLASIDDPHVVRLYEYVQDPGGAAIVMQLVDGVTLRRIVAEHGPTRPESALSVLRGSLLGLGAAHARGIVHRDYKPENVMVTGEGDSLLTDFGLASPATGVLASAGTPAYMAPEVWSDGVARPSGDIYAATAGFVECLTGRPPFGAEDLGMLRRQHEHAAVPVAEVPEPVRDLVARGLAKDPGQRPADAAAFLVELEAAALAGYGEDWEERGRRRLAERAALLALLFPLAAGAVGGSAVASTVLGRRRVRALLGAAAVLAVIGGAVVVANTSGSPTTIIGARPVGSLPLRARRCPAPRVPTWPRRSRSRRVRSGTAQALRPAEGPLAYPAVAAPAGPLRRPVARPRARRPAVAVPPVRRPPASSLARRPAAAVAAVAVAPALRPVVRVCRPVVVAAVAVAVAAGRARRRWSRRG